MGLKSKAKKRKLRTGRRVSITISLSDNEESNTNKRKKVFHDPTAKTSKSKVNQLLILIRFRTIAPFFIKMNCNYVHGIDCELEKGIQQHPGNKEIECIRLLWKEKFTKKASKEIEGGKETEQERVCGTVDSGMEFVVSETLRETYKETEADKEMEVFFQKSDAQKNIDDQHGASGLKDKVLQKNGESRVLQKSSESRDWEKHSKISALTPITLSSFDEQLDPAKDACTEKESSSEIVPYDGPCFDKVLMPTPQEPILEEPLTFRRISKKLRLPRKMEKEKEPVKDASSFDCPSFDLGLTPTPPDVNIDAVVEPMVEITNEQNEKLTLMAEKANEQETTNTTSPVAVLPVSFVKPNAIERKRKDVDKGKMPKKTSEIEPVRNKRLVKLTTTMKSPFKDRFVKLGVKCSQDEELLFDCIFSSTKEPCDFVFSTENGFALIRGIIESLYPGITLHVEVINVWSQICNFDERLRNPISMRRLFCHTGMMNEKYLNEKMSLEMLLAFNDNMENVLKSANVENISDIDLVFFPVLLEKSHYYLVVFNLKTPKIEIIDNSKNGSEADMKERYGLSLKKLRKYFLLYLGVKDHPRLELLKKVACNRLLMSWRTEENCIDCGVFMMRHMETYMGYTSAKNWKCGLKDEGPEQQNQIYELRKKYLSKILRSDINIKRSLVLDELEEYRRLPSDAKENLKNNRDIIQKYMDFQKKSKCTDLVKYSKLKERRAKEQESTSTTLSLVKNAPSFDAPSFDLGLTPTPPDADIKYQGMSTTNQITEVVAPMVANENLKLLAEKTNEQEPTTTKSPFAAPPLSFAMPSTSIITPTIESKRIVKPSETVKSPFLDRFVKLGDKCSQYDELLFNCMSLSTKNPCDFLFQTKNGFYIMRGEIESLYPGITVRAGVINGWSYVCNYEERLRSSDSMRRLFCHAGMISERMLKETYIVKAQTEFMENMTIVMKNANVDKISDIDMVFFPILLEKKHYYLIVFNLKTPKIELLDKNKSGSDVALEERYGETFRMMIRLFLGYLAFVEHPKFYSLRKVVCKRLEMSWRTEDNCIDSGVFLMRHMETYMGSALKNWKCGFKNEELNQQNQIYELRKKYTSKILKSDINVNKKNVLYEVDEYRYKPNDVKDKLLKTRFMRIQKRVSTMP
ncbi:ulp1 protease family, C-terminal catalytic domain-containing protein [Artemisia annua]|uniref:Ulp1 protease family, C-terminal catalytic domain-containing protein n=1 Tax=Artemisia annua TaxID=35608 RepID=A0A2U1KGT3_ARTAN|nr:ulp1 protease family, C-terminal catalytic domain-containing protein [Artemisia annua]